MGFTSLHAAMVSLCVVFGAIVWHWRPHYTKGGYFYILLLTGLVLGGVWMQEWRLLLALGTVDFIVFMAPINERIYWHHSETEQMVVYLFGKWISAIGAYAWVYSLCTH